MGNVTLPTPVFLAGGALCVLAGFLAGAVVGPDTPERTTAQVVSFDRSDERLCLQGDAVKGQEGVDAQGTLCGTLRRPPNSQEPRRGDTFRFVSVQTVGRVDGKERQQVVIYGDVAG